LSPETWDDKNDAFFLSEYKRLTHSKSVLALCFAEREETYHHWKVFSNGNDGVCIEFNTKTIKAVFDATSGIRHQSIKYEQLSGITKLQEVDIEQLPFYKRWPYGDEGEYRVIYSDMHEDKPFINISIKLNCVSKIILSPWLPKALVPAVKTTIKSINGCSRLKVYQSTLINNEDWKKLAERTQNR
jgi:hypothetical protein